MNKRPLPWIISTVLAVALIIAILTPRSCNKGGKETTIDYVPIVRDSIIYASDSALLAKGYAITLDSLRRQYGGTPPRVITEYIRVADTLYIDTSRVRLIIEESLTCQEALFSTRYYTDTIANDSVTIILKEEVTENRIDARRVTIRLKAPNKKKWLIYLGGSLGGGGKSGLASLDLTFIPKRKRFYFGYRNSSIITKGADYYNAHSIAFGARINR